MFKKQNNIFKKNIEYQEKKIIWVDYHNTLFKNNNYNINLINKLIKKQKNNYKIILWTGANEEQYIKFNTDIEKFGLKFDDIILNVKKPDVIIDDIAYNE